MSNTYPIIEFDPSHEALIEPSKVNAWQDGPEHCVICFFREALENVIAELNARVVAKNHWEDGSHVLYEIEYQGHRLGFFHPGIGAAIASALLEEAIAFGCKKFIACGGCGVLEKDIEVGGLVIVTSAVRDEGTSYHYLAPGREITANPLVVTALESVLRKKQLPYRLGKTWTTDAPYRETPALIQRRKQEGCIVVEMEAAGMMAVAQFRGVAFGQIVYGGDDLSGTEWDRRSWQTRIDVREALFWLAAEACIRL
jgi:uridine phosphorylase